MPSKQPPVVADVYDAKTRQPIGFVVSSPVTFKSYGPDGEPDGGRTANLLMSYEHDYRCSHHDVFFGKGVPFAEGLYLALLNGPTKHRKIEVHVRDAASV